MDTPRDPNERYTRIEATLALSLVLLKLHVLHGTWGKLQGYDWGAWIEMFHVTRWFEPLAPAMIWGASYHPPLSYLIGRLLYPFYPHENEISQLNSTLALIVTFFALRYVLRKIGWLYTLPGFWVLYGGMSIPVLISLGVETTYDSWVLTWFMLALALTVSLFWNYRVPPRWWRNVSFTRRVVALGLIFAAGQLNKYNGLMAFGLPVLVILLRRGLRATFREFSAPLAAMLICVIVVFPLYYERNFSAVGRWMPTAMDWQRGHDLKVKRLQRDAAPAAFILNMLRYPMTTPEDAQVPVLDSFPHISWLQTWTKDIWLGKQPQPSLMISRFYHHVFAITTFLGTLLFLLRRKAIPKDWRQLGWVLLTITFVYSAVALFFGWQFPLFDWRVFKTKYMSPVVFWVPFASALVFADRWFTGMTTWWNERLERLGYYALVSFMLVNHLLPVY